MLTTFPLRTWPFLTLVAATLLSTPLLSAQIRFTGVNLAGAEFGDSYLPGTYGTHYIYPTFAEVDYFVSKGMNVFRLPFRWERLQPSLNAPLNSAEFTRLNTFVEYATSRGACVILDPHNYARYWLGGRPGGTEVLIGSAQLPNSAFADFWSRLAQIYKNNPRVIFGLMNEPHDMPTEQWVSAANAAIAAIRAAGASNLILVPGNAWTGAWTWHQSYYGTPNAVAMLNVTDPLNNFAFEVHQYLDPDGSGTSSQIVSPTVGVERLAGFTQWLKDHNRRGFLGEFAVARSMIGDGPTQIGDEALRNMLDHIHANSDVWLGWTWWAAGPWWGNYMFTLEPTSTGADRPQMTILQPYLVGIPEPSSSLLFSTASLGFFTFLRPRR